MTNYFYIDDVLLPVTPGSMKTKIKNRNKTFDMVSGSEINILKSPGLTEVSFDCLLPAVEYSFARYENGFKSPQYYLDLFENLKKSRKPFSFTVMPMRTISAEQLLKFSADMLPYSYGTKFDYDFNGDGEITAMDAKILLRSQKGLTLLNNTKMQCTIEDYTINEDVEKYGRDVMVSLNLKQNVEFSLKNATYSAIK